MSSGTYKRTKTHCENISKVLQGRKLTKECCENISKVKRTKKWINNLIKSLTGRKLSEDHRKNISKGRKGIIFTTKHRENMSKASKGKKKSKLHTEAMRKATCEHHIDLDRKNNKKSNKLILSRSNHSKLHRVLEQYALSKLTKTEIKVFTKELIENKVISIIKRRS